MKGGNEIRPPRWAERLLAFYCRPELLEDLQGDLNEYFQRNLKQHGIRRARLTYMIDVFKFFRFYTIRKPEFINLLIQWVMIGSYIKTSGRSIVRNKLFSVINIFGLAISMSVGLMMIGIISDTFSYDQFNKNHKRIYRLVSHYKYLDRSDRNYVATSSLRAAKLVDETFSTPEAVAVFSRGFLGDFKTEDKTMPLKGYWANPEVFTIFSFEMLKGNPATVLKDPFTIVITETASRKLFGTEEALGKTVSLKDRQNKDRQYTITGVMKDIPAFSHVRFELLGSLSTREILMKEDRREMKWDNIWNTWTYVLLPSGANQSTFQAELDKLSAQEDPSAENTHIRLRLQPLDSIVAGEDMGNEIGPTMGSLGLWIFGALTFVVLLSSCFNYTNLSIARSLRRTKEVGIRKVIGALKGHVVGQFVVEAVIISLCSLLIAFVLFYFLRPYFLGLQKDLSAFLRLELSPSLIIYFILFAIAIGVMAGIVPAFFFSKINAIRVLKDTSGSQGLKKLNLRMVLIVFQYSLSIIFITSTVIFFKQYKHLVAFDLGYNTENVLNIWLQGYNADRLKKDIAEVPEVKGIAKSEIVTSVGSYFGAMMKYSANPLDSAGVYYNTVDENYIPLMEHRLLAGRNFNPQLDSLSESEVIVNEKVLKRFNIAGRDPQKALGEAVKLNGKELIIIGVMQDFHYGKISNVNTNDEVVFRYSPVTVSSGNFGVLNVKIESTDLLGTYEKIEAIWKKHDPVHPIEAKFYNEEIENAFSGFKAAVKLAGFLAFMTICIASLGLLGIVVFTTETRLKEVSIRKVLGASEARLIYLMSKGFFILLLVSACIGIPITYVFFQWVIFREIGNHLPISIPDLFIGVLGILVMAIVMIWSQTLKVARTNPAEVLKNE